MSRAAIFVSYRRRGEADAVGRICDRLIGRFGTSSVFQDVKDIPAGADFGAHILEKIADCQVLLAMIDLHWAASVLNNQRDEDWVREELLAAKRSQVPIVPVLLGNAEMPRVNELPEMLQWLPSLEATKVRGGRDFHTDIENLAEQLSRHVRTESGGRGAAADLWEELKHSEDLGALERFVETFNNTREAYDARGRLKQLKQVIEIREFEAGCDSFDSFNDEHQAEFYFDALTRVHDFLDAPSTEWHVEIERVNETLRQLASWPEIYEWFSLDYHLYHEERDRKGKPNRRW